jgi:deazaflavin-dependent oxidoreductase (nitroreductase family)
MPLPKGLARFNRKVTNRITAPFAERLPGFGVVHHVGRRSGRPYRTPINCWIGDGVITVPLTYGADVDWLKNLAAAGGGEIQVRGELIRLGPPGELEPEEGRRRIPDWVAAILPLIDVSEFREFPILPD